MKKKTRNQILFTIIGIIVILVIVFGLREYGLVKFEQYSGNYQPSYPFPLNNKLYSPVYGHIDCELVSGEYTAPKTLQWYSESFRIYNQCEECSKAVADFTCNEIGGCEFTGITGIKCSRPILGGDGCYGQGYDYSIKVNGIEGKTSAAYGENMHIEVYCTQCDVQGMWYAKLSPVNLSLEVKGKLAKLKVESYGYTIGGWLDGSDGCKLTSEDAKTLKNMQLTDNPIKDTDINELGKSINQIIVGWREDPAFDNINPQGQYNGMDVICRPFSELASIKKVGTIGGYTYYVKDQTLMTYSQNTDMCCDNTNCQSGYVCEKYKCVKNATVCKYGSCAWSVDQCGSPGCYELADGYVDRTFYCDENKCCQRNDKPVKCCPITCERMSTPSEKYKCNPDVGCVKQIYQDPCGNGYCCNVEGEGKKWFDITLSPYITQNCVGDKKCCYENPNDPYRGTCKDTCSIPQCKVEGESCVKTSECCTEYGLVCDKGKCVEEESKEDFCSKYPEICDNLPLILIGVLGIGLIYAAMRNRKSQQQVWNY